MNDTEEPVDRSSADLIRSCPAAVPDGSVVEAGVRAARSCFHAVRLGLARMLR